MLRTELVRRDTAIDVDRIALVARVRKDATNATVSYRPRLPQLVIVMQGTTGRLGAISSLRSIASSEPFLVLVRLDLRRANWTAELTVRPPPRSPREDREFWNDVEMDPFPDGQLVCFSTCQMRRDHIDRMQREIRSLEEVIGENAIRSEDMAGQLALEALEEDRLLNATPLVESLFTSIFDSGEIRHGYGSLLEFRGNYAPAIATDTPRAGRDPFAPE